MLGRFAPVAAPRRELGGERSRACGQHRVLRRQRAVRLRDQHVRFVITPEPEQHLRAIQQQIGALIRIGDAIAHCPRAFDRRPRGIALQQRQLRIDEPGQRQQELVQRAERLESVDRDEIARRFGRTAAVQLEHAEIGIDARDSERVAAAFERDARGAEVGERRVVAVFGDARIRAADQGLAALEHRPLRRQYGERVFVIPSGIGERAAAHARRTARGQSTCA